MFNITQERCSGLTGSPFPVLLSIHELFAVFVYGVCLNGKPLSVRRMPPVSNLTQFLNEDKMGCAQRSPASITLVVNHVIRSHHLSVLADCYIGMTRRRHAWHIRNARQELLTHFIGFCHRGPFHTTILLLSPTTSLYRKTTVLAERGFLMLQLTFD